MLHILLFILKIIGIILAAILGILVLLLCIVIFVPVRYRISAQCDGTLDGLKADVKVTWLFHLVRAVFHYEKQTSDYKVRIAWKKLGEEKKGETEHEEKNKEERYEKMAEADSEISKGDEVFVQEAEKRPGLPEKTKEKQEEADEIAEAAETKSQKDSEKLEESHSFFQNIKKIFVKIRRFFDRVYEAVSNIKCTFYKFCDKIKMLLTKKDNLTEFIEDEIHKTAFFKSKKEVFRLLKKLRPKKFITDVTYGFEDPYYTGQVLAGLSVMYPFWGKQVRITPDFEQRILEGSLYTAGRIRVLHLIVFLWNMVWCKEVRRTYKDIRKFRG